MKFVLSLLVILAYIQIVCGQIQRGAFNLSNGIDLCKLVQNPSRMPEDQYAYISQANAESFSLNGGATFGPSNTVNLLPGDVTEAGLSMYSLERFDFRGGITMSASITTSQKAYSETKKNRLNGFAFVMQNIGPVVMGSANTGFALGTLKGAIAAVADLGAGNTYQAGVGSSAVTSSASQGYMVVVQAPSPTQNTEFSINTVRLTSAFLPPVATYLLGEQVFNVTFVFRPLGKDFRLSINVCHGRFVTSGYGCQETPAITVTEASIASLFSNQTAHFGITTSIGACTGDCPTIKVSNVSIKALSHGFLIPRVLPNVLSYTASGNYENQLVMVPSSTCDLTNTSGLTPIYFDRRSIQSARALAGFVAPNSSACAAIFADIPASAGLLYRCVVDLNLGTLTISYSTKIVGQYTAKISIPTLATTPYNWTGTWSYTITGAAASPALSLMQTTPALPVRLVAGQPVSVTMIVKDIYGNLYTAGTQPRTSYRFGCCAESVSTTHTPNSSGKYQFNISTQRATEGLSSETVEFKLFGTTVYQLTDLLVLPAVAVGSSSYLSGDGLTQANVGEDAVIYLQVGDTYSNVYVGDALQDALANVQMSIQTPNGAEPLVIQGEPLVLNVERNLVKFVYKTNKAGVYTLNCKVSGYDCFGRGIVSIDVRPGEISTETKFSPSIAVTGTVGSLYSANIVPYDRFNNKISREAAADTVLRVWVTAKGATPAENLVARVWCSSSTSKISCAPGYDPEADNQKLCTYTQSSFLDSLSCVPDPSGDYKVSFNPKLTSKTQPKRVYELKATLQIRTAADATVSTKDVEISSLEASASQSSMTLTSNVFTGAVSSSKTWNTFAAIPGKYTGNYCGTECIRAGTEVTITYQIYDSFGNCPSANARSVIFASVSSADTQASAAVVGDTTLVGNNSKYTQKITLRSAVEYSFALTVGGVNIPGSITKAQISPAKFHIRSSKVFGYAENVWSSDFTVPGQTSVNHWKTYYYVTTYDEYGNRIYFNDDTQAGVLLGSASDFAANFTPSPGRPGGIQTIAPRFIAQAANVQVGASTATTQYNIPASTVAFEIVHTYPSNTDVENGELKFTYGGQMIDHLFLVTVSISSPEHHSVFYKSPYTVAVGDMIAPANTISGDVYMMAGHDKLYTSNTFTTELSVFAIFFGIDKKHIEKENPTFSIDVTGPITFSTRKFEAIAGKKGQSSLQLNPRDVGAAEIKLTSGGVTSLVDPSKYGTLSLKTIHGIPTSENSNIRSVQTFFVAGENNLNFTFNVFDAFRNTWVNKLKKPYQIKCKIFKIGETDPVSFDGPSGTDELTSNVFNINAQLTTAGDYALELTFTYTALGAPTSITLPKYNFNVIGGKVGQGSVLKRCDENAAWTCTAGNACSVCFESQDQYGNKVVLTKSHVERLEIAGVNSLEILTVSTFLSAYRITFISKKTVSEQFMTLVLDPSIVQDTSARTFTSTSGVTIEPSPVPGKFTMFGLNNMSPTPEVSLECEAYDQYGNRFLKQPIAYKLAVSRVGGTLVLVSGVSYDNNTGRVRFAPVSFTVAATYHFQLTLSSTVIITTENIDSAQHPNYVGYKSLVVRVGNPFAGSTVLSKKVFTDTVEAGVVTSFELTYRDIYLNVIPVTQAVLSAFPATIAVYEKPFTCADNSPVAGTSSTLIAIPASDLVITVADDKVLVSLTVTRANALDASNLRARYYVATFVNSQFIAPCLSSNNELALATNFIVVPSKISPAKTVVTRFPVDETVETRTNIKVTLEFADRFDNLLADGFKTGQIPDVKLMATPGTGCGISGHEDVVDIDGVADISLNADRGTASFNIATDTTETREISIGVTVLTGDAEEYIGTCIKYTVFSANPYQWKINKEYYETTSELIQSNRVNHLRVFAFDVGEHLVDPTLGSPFTDYHYVISMTYAKHYVVPISGEVIGADIVGAYTHRVETTNIDLAPTESFSYDDITGTSKPYTMAKVHSAEINPAWPGTYYIQIELVDESGIERERSLLPFLTTPSSQVVVVPSNCYARDGKKQIYCELLNGTMGCAEDWAECKSKVCESPKVWSDGQCVAESSITCAAPNVKCKTIGSNDVEVVYCATSGTCENERFIYSEEYRSNVGFVTECSVDQLRCSDGQTCVYDAAKCPTTTVCPASQVSCSDGFCANSSEECGTRVTCPDDQVLTAGICVAADEVVVYSDCLGGASRCSDGSCRASFADCPSHIVCPVNTYLCDNGLCVSDIASCTARGECEKHEMRCPDGSCALDISFCSAKVTCPAHASVLCNDGTCVPNLSYCKPKAACPTSRPHLCADKSCAKESSQCPTPSACNPTTPVKCMDGSCAATVADCPLESQPLCPSYLPVLCSDGSCRKTNAYCPIFKSCPASLPVRCVNDECVMDAALCPTTVMQCAPGYVRCKSGQCAPNHAACSTILTCPVGQYRCADGTCRRTCLSTLSSNYRCPASKVMCPTADAGLVCANKLAECPQSIVCPASSPVRCLDMYCAGSTDECNAVKVDAIPATRVPCGNGFWSNSYDNCGTSASCPSHAPVKCWDQSCRKVAEDCPEQHGCPIDTPFLCSDGSCVLNPWSCAITKCRDPTPVRCPSSIGTAPTCVAKLEDCPNLFDLKTPAGSGKCLFGQRCWDGSCTSELRYCPDRSCSPGFPFLCPSGVCAKDSRRCPTLGGCPWDIPHFCKSSSTCVESEAACSLIEKPVCGTGRKLCDDGSCRTTCNVSSFGCSALTPNVCANKECVSSPSNVGSDTVLACIGLSDAVNACPAARPFRCPGGFCATSSTRCPHVNNNDSLWSAGSQHCRYSTAMMVAGDVAMDAFCDDGSCAYSLSQCPIIKPCEKGTFRCQDGTCREPIPECAGAEGFESPLCRVQIALNQVWSNACPAVSTCPPSRPYRCQDGLCVADRDQCIDNYPVILNKCCGASSNYAKPTDQMFGTCNPSQTPCVDIARDGDENLGCPQLSTRCETGVCVFNGRNTKFSDVSCEIYDSFREASGCPLDQVRCPNGFCVDDVSECPLHNGCLSDTPFKCASGICVVNKDDCVAPAVCTAAEFKCPNGQCVSDVASCNLQSGCPVDKPILCADGQCKKFAASYKMGDNVNDYCPINLVCSGVTPFLCADGTCAPSSDLCRPISPCAEHCAVRCPGSLECVVPETSSPNSCPVLDASNWASLVKKCGPATTCPEGAPFLCGDGSCQTSITRCSDPLVSATSPSCPEASPIRCWTGACVKSYAECIWSTYALFHKDRREAVDLSVLTSGSAICPDELHVCPNGLCVADVTTCEVARACPANTMRCSDGSCAATCSQLTCGENLVACVDGTCRENCPMFLGCPVQAPFYCPKKKEQCVANKTTCDAEAIVLLEDVEGQEVCETNCDRDVPATAQSILVTPSMSDISIDVSTNSNGSVRTKLVVASNSFTENVLFEIQPVPSVFFDGGANAKNITTPFTITKMSNSSPVAGQFAKTVLSTPFRCSINATPVDETRMILPLHPMAYSASLDTTSFEKNDAVTSDMPCEMIGHWDAATLIESDDTIDASSSKKCVATMTFTSDSFAIAMEDPACDYDFSMAGPIVSHQSISAWNFEHSSECMCFNIVNARGEYVNILGKDVCMLANRTSLGLQIFFEEGFRPTISGSPDFTKLGSCSNLPAFSRPNPDISAYLIRTDSATDPCSYANSNSGAINKQDICLGTYTANERWECARDREGRISVPVWVDGMHEKKAIASIDDCTANAYAFIYSALPPPDPEPEEQFCWWCNYGKYVLGIGISVLAIVLITLIALIIFSRHRAAYQKEKVKLDELHTRAKELDEYAGGLGIADEDGEVVMVANPLVLQMQELQKQLDMYNQQMDTQGKHEEYEIQRLEMQRQRIKDELLRIQQELEKQNVEATKPQRLDAPRSGHVLSMAPAGPVAASGPSGPVAASGPMAASAGPSSFGAGPSGPVAAPRKTRDM